MILKKTKKITPVFIALALMLPFTSCNGGDNSEWVYNIEGKKITINQIEQAYDGQLFMLQQQLNATGQNISIDDIKNWIEKPETAPDPRMAAVLAQYSKKNFVQQYLNTFLLNLAAEKEGFNKKDSVQQNLEFLKKYFVASMYMMHKAKPGEITITDAEALAEWEKIRQTNPRAQAIPIEQGLEYAKSQMRSQKMMQKQAQVGEDIKNEYKIKKNTDFDLDAYLGEKAEDSEEKGEGSKEGEPENASETETK